MNELNDYYSDSDSDDHIVNRPQSVGSIDDNVDDLKKYTQLQQLVDAKFDLNNVIFSHCNQLQVEKFKRIVRSESEHPYLVAAKYGKLRIIKVLENDDRCNIYIRDEHGYDAYLIAARYGHVKIMKHLVEKHNWDVFVENEHRMDAMFFACECGHLNVIKYLIEEHDYNIYSLGPDNAYELAVQGGYIDVMEYLEYEHGWFKNNLNYIVLEGEQIRQRNLYILAAAEGRLNVIMYLTSQYGDNPNQSNEKGENAYLLAAGNGHINVMEYLETCWGFDALKYFSNNLTHDPYLYAKASSQTDVMKYLELKYNWSKSDLAKKSSLYGKKRKLTFNDYERNVRVCTGK